MGVCAGECGSVRAGRETVSVCAGSVAVSVWGVCGSV